MGNNKISSIAEATQIVNFYAFHSFSAHNWKFKEFIMEKMWKSMNKFYLELLDYKRNVNNDYITYPHCKSRTVQNTGNSFSYPFCLI